MSSTTVVRLRKSEEHGIIQDCDIYIAGTIKNKSWDLKDQGFGNPFSEKKFGKELSMKLYRTWLGYRIEKDPGFIAKLLSLDGKRLGCWCNKDLQYGLIETCHGDILIEKIEQLKNINK